MRARFPLAVALFELKQTTDARREFEAVRREVGDHPNVSYYLGRLDLLDRNYAAAIRDLTKAIAKPPFPDTAYYLGLACFKQGDAAAAEKWLRQAAQANPRDSLAQYHLGMVYRKLGRDDEAKKAFAESADLRRRDTDESQLAPNARKSWTPARAPKLAPYANGFTIPTMPSGSPPSALSTASMAIRKPRLLPCSAPPNSLRNGPRCSITWRSLTIEWAASKMPARPLPKPSSAGRTSSN